jgi:choline dehydrogenase
VSGVRYRDRRGREHLATAAREVILAAGAIGSPQLLMLSGVGPAAHLRELGIDVAVDAPEVGENLQDHPFNTVVSEVTEGSLVDAERPRFVAEWVLRRSGPLTSTVAEAFAFVRTRPGLPAPDIQFHFAPAYFVEHGAAEFDGHALTLGPVLVSPRSRGRLRLRSADPTVKPSILTNTLAERDDVAALVAGMKLARELVGTEPLRSMYRRELFPGDDVRTDDELEADLRRRVELLYHPSGTCRMGTDETAVVDAELRVRGIDGLRVVDASIFPLIPGGNTNAPTIAVAERASDLIRGRVAPGAPSGAAAA